MAEIKNKDEKVLHKKISRFSHSQMYIKKSHSSLLAQKNKKEANTNSIDVARHPLPLTTTITTNTPQMHSRKETNVNEIAAYFDGQYTWKTE